jgi:polysaccharide biosynthesis transport protein
MNDHGVLDLEQPAGGPDAGLELAPPPAADAATAPPGYGVSLDTDEVHLSDYLKVVYKRRWTAIAAFLVVFVSATVYTFAITPIYQARTQLLIEKESSNVVSFKEAFDQNQIADDYYQTQYKILQSRALARRTIDALRLWDHPLLGGGAAANGPAFSILHPSTYALAFGAPRTTKAGTPAVNETKVQSRVIDRFLAGLAVSPVRNSRLVDVSYNSPDPVFSTDVTNALAKAYIEQNLEFKFLATKEASDWLGERLGEQKKQVETSEQALQRYREQTDSVSLEDKQNVVVQKLADLNAAVTRAKTERIQKETLYNQVRVMNDRTALDTVAAVLSNTFIQQQKTEIAELQRQRVQLGEKLGARHPDMLKLSSAIQAAEAKLQAETAKVVQSLKNDYLASLSQEQSLMAALDAQKRDAQSLSRKGIDYGALQRDATSNRQIFDSLMQRTKETGIAGELKTSNIRVVDPAEEPRNPASPNKTFNLSLGLFGGLVFGLGLSFFFEYMDNRIKAPDELTAHLGLTYLGMVPALPGKAGRDPLITGPTPQGFAEAFRAIRTSVLFSCATEGGRSILVTSTGPSEGKTVVSSNISIALAQAGQRVLLVDGDMRKPRIHSVLAVNQEPGLSNVLVGTSKVSEAVHKTAVANLWVLPAGVIPPNPAELLGARRFKDLLATLQKHFDWVILDTPPVMAVTDSCVVAHLTNGVLFVVGAEMTSRYSAARAIEQIVHAKGHLMGGVLNRVDLAHNPYYYSQYYRREYGSYYQPAPAAGGVRT